MQEADKSNKAVYPFIEFLKAFETVNHNILLKKLDRYGNKVLLIN